MKFLVILLFVVYNISGEYHAFASQVRNGRQQTNVANISVEVCLNPEINRQDNPNFVSNFEFQPFTAIQLKKETRYWLRITIDNHTLTEKENYLHFNNAFAKVVLWQYDKKNGWIKTGIGGYGIPYSKRERGILYEDKLLFHVLPGDKTELLVSAYQPNRNITLKNQCKVISKIKFEKENTFTSNIQFWFAGIISVLCIFSMILFLFMRNKAFIIYALYAMITEIYFLAFFNIIEVNILVDYPQINKYLYYMLTLSQSLYFLFLNDLLKQINGIKRQKFVTKYAIVSFSVALLIILFSLFSYQGAILLSDIYTIINGIVGLYIIAITYKNVPRRIRIVYNGFYCMQWVARFVFKFCKFK